MSVAMVIAWWAMETFAAVCELAWSYRLACTLEFMVFSKARDLQEAIAIVAAAGAPNASVLIDSLHLFRPGGSVADVARVAQSKPGLIRYVQLCDTDDRGPAPDEHTARQEASYARLVPGDGSLSLASSSPPAVNCPISVEAPPAAGAGVDPLAFARHSFMSTRRVLTLAASHT
jgi:sugar phosphate isomerase/epimerase